MTLVGVAVGLGTLLVGTVAAFALRTMRSVRQQLAGLALVAVILPLGAILVSGLVMFQMGNEGDFVFITCAVTTSGLFGAFVLARNIVRPLDTMRRTSQQLASGDLGARVPLSGPSELSELGSSFNGMAAHLEEVFDARRELVAWASHDLRAPITSLQAMLEAIEDGIVEPRHYLGALQSQVRLLGALVDDLFELACIDSGAVSLDFARVDVELLVASCVHRFDAEARARGLALSMAQGGGTTQSRCAPDKIERVLANLITNAMRYTPAGGRITVSIAGGAGAVLVAVEDTGIGIAPDMVERVFEPFWRADQARSSAGGAGLGLAIARGLIEAQGGRIWAEPPAAGGTRVTFVLPAVADGVDAPLDASTIAVAKAYFAEQFLAPTGVHHGTSQGGTPVGGDQAARG
ncbi:MAG TPA: HAMP domain-containing sensor histidine kinase [Acidimicrobiales bacterium]|nr:HAMP domain-containing sensor histidine kinase [Acidimicrobiales bacterium]